MNSVDLNEIALLWQEEPTPEEQREFHGLAGRAARQAQLVQFAEHGLGLLLIVAVLIAVLMAPAPATVAIGGLSIFALSWSSWKRHLLSQVAQLLGTNDRQDLVRFARARAEANLKHSTVGLWLFMPGVLSGSLLTHALFEDGSLSSFPAHIARAAVTWPGPLILAVLLVVVVQLVAQNMRLRRESERLDQLGWEYREEARLDACSPG